MDSYSRKLDIFHIVINKNLHPETAEIKIKFLFFFCFIFFRDLFDFFNWKSKEKGLPDIENNKLYVHIESLNNYRSLKFLENYYEIKYFTKAEATYLNDSINLHQLVISSSFWRKWIFLWKIFFSRKLSIKNYWAIDKYFYVFENALEHFRGPKPPAVFFANDHNPFSRSLLLAFNDLDIPTFYYQHGSISKTFPSLKFKVSFLYGMQDYKTYKVCGNVDSEVHLVGIQRMDNYEREQKITRLEDVRQIGVAYNPTDVLENVNTLIKNILNEETFKFDVVVRPHPREIRSVEKELLDHPRVYQSNPKTENSQDFLLTVDMILAGTSGIILEGVLLNKWAIECNVQMDYIPKDYYEYIKNKIALYCPDIEDIGQIIRKMNFEEKPLSRAKQYDASVEEPYFSEVGRHIKEI